jgi:septum formation protein
MARARKGELVVAADTAVVQGKQILGKPAGPKDHDRKLRILSGRSHEVLTALVVFLGGKRQVKVCRSRVKFRKLSMAERRAYIQSGEGRGAAGGYKIQGPLSGLLIQSVQGSFSSVVGFPLEAFEKQLRKICDLEFALWNCRS